MDLDRVIVAENVAIHCQGDGNYSLPFFLLLKLSSGAKIGRESASYRRLTL